MGLETVEIVMDIEDRFRVGVPDEVATRCVTVADLQRELVVLLESQGRVQSPELEREVFDGIVQVVVKQTGLPANKVRPESRWIGDITRYG